MKNEHQKTLKHYFLLSKLQQAKQAQRLDLIIIKNIHIYNRFILYNLALCIHVNNKIHATTNSEDIMCVPK